MKPQFSGSAKKIIYFFIPASIILLGLYSVFIATAHNFLGDQEAFLMLPATAQYDTPITIKAVVRKHENNAPIADASVTLHAVSIQRKIIPLFSGKTDSSGIAATTFKLPPELQAPELKLVARIHSKDGRDDIERTLPLSYSSKTSLSCDRSFYAPGDTLHVRTVTEECTTSQPLAGEYVELIVRDPRGTAIFIKKERTSQFGVCTFECRLADKVRKGRYTVAARSFNTEETRTIRVGDYAEPAFRIALSPSQRYFLLDEEIRGTVTVTSYDGEAVAQAAVSISIAVDTDSSRFSLDRIKGFTGADGQFTFVYRLGEGTKEALKNQKKTVLGLQVEAQNNEGKRITLTRTVPLSDRAIIIKWLPDGNGFVPGISNGSYMITFYPDGTPAPSQLTLSSLKISKKLTTDAWGLALLPFDPSTDGNDILTVKAVDSKGNTSEKPFEISSLISPHSFTLTTSQTIYKAGDTAEAEISSLQKQGFIFLDLVHMGQIVLSRTLPIENGKARISLPLPQSLHGILQLRATTISSDGAFEEESRVLFVIPAEKLSISLRPDRKEYLPGQKAHVSVFCTGRDRLPHPSVLEVMLKGKMDAGSGGSSISIPLTTPQSLFSESFYQALTEEQIPENLEKLISNPAFQERARLAFTMIPDKSDSTGNINVYAEKLKANQQRRGRYFFTLFLIFFRLVIAVIMISFLIILGLTLAHTYLKGLDEKRVLVFRNSEEVVSLLIFIIGFFLLLLCPLMFALPISYFSNIPLLEIRYHSFFQIFLAFELFLMFIYLLTLWRNVRVRPIRKMSTLKYTFLTLQWYVGAFIVLISLLFTRSITNWNITEVIAINRPYMLMALFTLTVMPFVLLYSTFSHLIKPKAAKPGRVTFFLSTVAIVAVIITSSVLILIHGGAGVKEPSQGRPGTVSAAHTGEASTYNISSALPEDLENEMRSSELFFYMPERVTDKKGETSITFTLPSTLNPLVLLARGRTEKGDRGTASLPLPVRCDFTINAPIPLFMSIGDSLSLPVQVSNCTDRRELATLAVLHGSGIVSPIKKPVIVELSPRESRTFQIPIIAWKTGEQTLSLCVQKGKNFIFKTGTVKVIPLTDDVITVKSGRINNEETVALPSPASSTGKNAGVRLVVYPTILALLNECSRALSKPPLISFDDVEAAASADVQLLKYMKAGALQNKELEKEAVERVNLSIQRLLTFQSDDGGFSRFGSGRCSPWMTARALSCLGEMAEVYPVDPSLIQKIIGWLKNSQKSDGSWEKSSLTTARVLYALKQAGAADNHRISKARDFLKKHLRKDIDDTILALGALFIYQKDTKSPDLDRIMQKLQRSAVITNNIAYWSSPVSIVQKGEKSPSPAAPSPPEKGADIRTTALCARALILSGISPELKDKALNFLLQSRDESGCWHSSISSTEALRTLAAGALSPSEPVRKGLISLSVKGKIVQNVVADAEKSDRAVEIDLDDSAGLQKSGFSFIAEDAPGASYVAIQAHAEKSRGSSQDNPVITSTFSGKRVGQGQTLKNVITIMNRSMRDFSSLIVEIPVPPAFELSKGTLDSLKENTIIEEYALKDGIIYLYIEDLKKEDAITLPLTMKALYPARIKTLPARVYESYNTDVYGVSRRAPLEIE
ncbi:MAG: MG2 domain-containing protein [Candidatus Xenobiia bacterium LiM19]